VGPFLGRRKIDIYIDRTEKDVVPSGPSDPYRLFDTSDPYPGELEAVGQFPVLNVRRDDITLLRDLL